MSVTAVGNCSRCAAVVNIHWPTCLVCHALIAPSREPRSNAKASLPQPQGDDGTELSAPMPPLQPSWLVVYRDQRGALCGGCDDRPRGTVGECRWEENGWTVHLTDGQRLPLSLIRSVGQTDDAGQVVAAWTVREHGFDGEGPLCNRGKQNAI